LTDPDSVMYSCIAGTICQSVLADRSPAHNGIFMFRYVEREGDAIARAGFASALGWHKKFRRIAK
jgi:hypothetical protein